MAFSIFCLVEACVLLLNCLAILNPRYFLKNCKKLYRRTGFFGKHRWIHKPNEETIGIPFIC